MKRKENLKSRILALANAITALGWAKAFLEIPIISNEPRFASQKMIHVTELWRDSVKPLGSGSC